MKKKKEDKPLTVGGLIKVLQKNVDKADIETCDLTFWIKEAGQEEETEYEIEGIGKFGIVNEATITLRKVKNPIVFAPLNCRASKKAMVMRKVKPFATSKITVD